MPKESAPAPIFLEQNPNTLETGPSQEELLRLVNSAKSGDIDSFGQLAESQRNRLMNVVSRFALGPNVEPEDLVQRTFEKAQKAINKYEPSAAPVSAWFDRIAKNCAIDEYRKRTNPNGEGKVTSIHEGIYETKSNNDPEHLAQVNLDILKLREAMKDLSTLQRAAIDLKYVEGLDYDEIAEKLGRSVPTVRVLVSRSLKKLRASIDDLNTLNVAPEAA